jgi:DNA-binding NtrC family response regulator
VRALAAQPWPGNVRELRNAIERACALAKGQRSAPSAPAGPAQLEALLGLELKDAQAQWLEVLQRAYVGHALSRAGTVSGAARLAGVNRKHIQRLMKRFGIANGDDP